MAPRTPTIRRLRPIRLAFPSFRFAMSPAPSGPRGPVLGRPCALSRGHGAPRRSAPGSCPSPHSLVGGSGSSFRPWDSSEGPGGRWISQRTNSGYQRADRASYPIQGVGPEEREHRPDALTRARGIPLRWVGSDLDGAVPDRERDRLELRVDPQLGEDVPYVRLHGLLADRQLLGDAVVAHTLGEEPEHLELALGELAEEL